MIWYIQLSWRENTGSWFSTSTVCGKNNVVWDTRFLKKNRRKVEEKLVGHGVEEHEVRYGNGV